MSFQTSTICRPQLECRASSAPVLCPQPSFASRVQPPTSKRKSLGDICDEVCDEQQAQLRGEEHDVVLPLQFQKEEMTSFKVSLSERLSRRRRSSFENISVDASSLPLVCREVIEKRNMLYPTHIGEYTFIKTLGKGAGGKVKLAKDREGHKVAIKVCRNETDVERNTGPTELERIANEATCLHMCRGHHNVTNIVDFLKSDRKHYIVTDYMDGGDLWDYVAKRGYLPQTTSRAIFRSILEGLKHIHASGVGHRDVKPENILLNRKGNEVKLCDFGFAVKYKNGDTRVPGTMGTVRCLAPEMIRRPGWAHPVHNPFLADVWSCGTVLFFMLSGKFPFETNSDRETLRNTIRGNVVQSLPRAVPDSAHDLFKTIFQLEPKDRPTIDEILSHPFMMQPLKHESSY